MSQSPTVHDNDFSLWLKVASNLYDYAIAQGVAGLTPPKFNDNDVDLVRKISYYTALIAS